MAFAPASLNTVAAVKSELWSALASGFAGHRSRESVVLQARWQATPRHEAKSTEAQNQIQQPSLPNFMAMVPVTALRPGLPNVAVSALRSGFSASSILSSQTQSTLCHASPFSRASSPFSSVSRSLTTSTTATGSLPFRTPFRKSFTGFSQQRSFWGTSWGSNNSTNRNILAQMEQTANNNPGSATAQNAFYQALLRANMPEIIVERYQNGRYAKNAAVDQVYTRALERIGAAEAGSAGVGSLAGRTPGGQSNDLSSEQLQAIGQAVAAKTHGSSVGISKPGSRAKGEALYVVVDESMSSYIFKWFKFLAIFAFTAYCSLVVFTLVIEATGVLKRVGGTQNAEAKPELQTTRFSDVHGCDEAKEELQELVEFLKAPEKFSTLGGKLPKGVMLVGPPGTGKTLLARAVAGEAGVPFFYMSGSEFDEIYVGVGAKRVRDLFAAARAKNRAIIFIDELDAIGGKRQERDAAYAKQTLNQLLTELDGFDQNSGVIVMGATNFPQSLDKALTRPGRFDRNVTVPLPDVRGRIAILKYHLRNIRTDASVDPAEVARGCPGFSGAELENVVNQAAVRASKNKAQKVGIEDLVWAKDKIMMGAERKSAVIQQKDKVMTAYHEGGHALVAMLTEAATPLYKATIMPRGHALGITFQLPELDKVSESKRELMAKIDVCMGGKVAEELIYGADNVTTGASSDIQQATSVAYSMVTMAGMSEKLGNIDLNSDYERLSSETKQTIEAEVRRLVEEGRERAIKLLTSNREGLERLAKALVEYETLNREEMEKVVRGEKLLDKIKVDVSTPVKMPEPGNLLPPPQPVDVGLPSADSPSGDTASGQPLGSP